MTVMTARFCRICLALVLFLAATRTTLAATYEIVPLNVLPDDVDSLAFALNDNGLVTGDSRQDRTGNIAKSRAVLWDTTSTPQLLWTADISSGIYPGGSASAINNHGRIAGRAQFIPDQGFPLPGPGIPLGRAFVWDAASGVRLLGTLGGSVSQATGIDDAGRVVGSAEDLAGIPRAFLWDETHGMQDLGTLGGLYSFANAINNAGQVVGYSADENEQQHAFLWDPIAGMQNLGAGAFSGSRAFGVNSAGQVVGSLLDPGTRAFVWDSQVGIKLLDASLGHGTTAYAINDAGFVVGYSAGDRARASLWNPAGNAFALEDLIDPSLGWELEIAFDINNRGQIVGYGILNDQVRGFLMSPVPEPSTLALTAIGALALTVVAARSRTAH